MAPSRPSRTPAATRPRRDKAKPAAKGRKAVPATAGGRPSQPVRGGQLSLPPDLAIVPPAFPEISDPKRRLYLQALCVDGRYGRAARAAGIDARTGWEWRHKDVEPVFAAALEVALKIGIENHEDELWRRGIHGYETPVYHQGQLVGTEREFDTTAAIFMLKGAKPEVYRERFDHQHSGPNGGPVQHQVLLASLSADEVRAKMREAMEVIEATALPAAAPALEPTPAERYAAELQARGNGHNGNGSGT